MEIHEFSGPKRTVDGIVFDTMKLPIQKPIQFPREMNKIYSEKRSDNCHELKEYNGKKIENIETISSGFFSSEAMFLVHFYGGRKINIKPKNLPYLDADIHFKKINQLWRPKIYAGAPDGYPSNFNEFSMIMLDDNDYLRGLKISSLYVHSKSGSVKPKNSSKEIIYSVVINGKLDFSIKDKFSYGHEEDVTVKVYPDIIHQCVEENVDLNKKEYYLDVEF